MNLAKNGAESVWDDQKTNKINKQSKKQIIAATVMVLAWDEYYLLLFSTISPRDSSLIGKFVQFFILCELSI